MRAGARPVLSLFVIACAVSLMTSGRITLRIVAPAMINWSFIPLLEIASLAIVSRRRPTEIRFGSIVDLFFRNQWPALLWLICFAAAWACFPAPSVIPWWSKWWVQYASAGAALGWSARLDYSLFRYGLKRTPRDAFLQLVSQRLLCWIPAILIFVAPSALAVIAWTLGL